jgi:hypothetical protein
MFALLIIYQLKHFVCDYPLQGKYMLGKFKPYPAFILPLLAHVSIHGVATLVIVACYKPLLALPLALFDILMHFAMDAIKANPKALGRFKPLTATGYMVNERMAKGLSADPEQTMPHMEDRDLQVYKDSAKNTLRGNTFFWWSLGLDQMVHHLTHYAIIFMVLK